MTVSGEQSSPVGIERATAAGTECWGEPPVGNGAGKDFMVDGALVFIGQMFALVPSSVPLTERTWSLAAAES